VAQKSARNIQIDPDSLNLMPAISAAVFEWGCVNLYKSDSLMDIQNDVPKYQLNF
jgi:hypothetical protein